MNESEQLYLKLKDNSNYYPEIFILERDKITYFSTLLRIYREGHWMVVHCVKEYHLSKIGPMEAALNFGTTVYFTQQLYQFNETTIEDFDPLQATEQERLERMSVIEFEYEKYTVPD